MTAPVLTRTIFDGAALTRALDAQRTLQGLRWPGVAAVITAQSAELRAATGDHDLCAGALVRTVQRQTMSCQYALMLLRWLDRVPEDFLTSAAVDVEAERLPVAGPHERLRWDLPALHAEVNDARGELGLTWSALATLLDCSPNQLTNLKKARDADMDLVMRVTQWLARPSVRFIRAVSW